MYTCAKLFRFFEILVNILEIEKVYCLHLHRYQASYRMSFSIEDTISRSQLIGNKIITFLQSDQAVWETPSHQPGSAWPEEGVVQFNNVSAQYRKDLDPVLVDISFISTPSEKV